MSIFLPQIDLVTEFGSIAEGSPILNPDFTSVTGAIDVAVCAGTGEVFIPQNSTQSISALSSDGEELTRIDGRGSAKGTFASIGANPVVAVDQSNCHLLVFETGRSVGEEYEPSGTFVAQFGSFTDDVSNVPFRVAVDNGATSPNR